MFERREGYDLYVNCASVNHWADFSITISAVLSFLLLAWNSLLCNIVFLVFERALRTVMF